MTKFLLIRHALTDSAGKRLSGRMAGVHLNEEGRKQAEALAQRLEGVPITAIYSSPLERATQTAAPLSRMLKIDAAISADFMEIDFGEWTDRSIDEMKNDPQFRLFNSFRSATRIPGGELMPEAQLRIVKGMERLCIEHRNETIAIISHSDLIKAALAYFTGIHLDMLQRIEISPASVSVVEMYDETARIMVVNDRGGIKVD